MIVYVESNFPLELARQQEESAEAESILKLAETGKIDLAFPAIAVTEPFSTLDRYAADRARFLQSLNTQLSDLARSQPNQPLVANFNPLVATLTSMRKDETDRLEFAVERMLKCGRNIQLTEGIFSDARIAESQYDMTPQDAIVFASIVHHVSKAGANANGSAHCFVSKNSKDFTITRGDLLAKNCEYKAKFLAALQYVTHHT